MRYSRKAAAVAAGVVIGAAGFVAGDRLVDDNDSSSRSAPRALTSSTSCQVIGFQSGVAASMNRLRRLDPGGTNATKTGAYDKLERTLAILAHDHDRACSSSGPTPTPTVTTSPTPTTTTPPANVAPQTYNRAANGSNARYCVAGLPRNSDGRLFDAFATYDDDGRQLGGRSEQRIDVLRDSDNMNSLGPCDGYQEGGRTFPPWPSESYSR